MPADTLTASGAMEGKGAYNRHAALQAGGVAHALPHWEKAVQTVPLGNANRPIVIADYGSSQGRNSCPPLQIAIKMLRARLGAARAIQVFHIDIPANDFNALFEVLERDPDRYVVDEPNVFPCAVARSFYENVLPAEQVDLGWSSYAAMWFSRTPPLIPGHFCVSGATIEIKAEFARQGARDWEKFLELRATELRMGGRLVVVVPAAKEDGWAGFADLMDHANAVLAAMVDEQAITAEERRQMVLGSLPRTKTELVAPFSVQGNFHGLALEYCEVAELEDPAWAEYRHTRDAEALARRHAAFFRSTFAPTLARALTSHDSNRVEAFSEGLERGLRHRLSRDPAPVHSLVGTIVLLKR